MATAIKTKQLTKVQHFLFGALSALCTVVIGSIVGMLGGARQGYTGLVRPTFTPPDVVFSIVWPVLYAMMGVSFYLTLVSRPLTREKRTLRIVSFVLFFVQLFINLSWVPLFFKGEKYFLGFVWLAVLNAVITALIIINFKVNTWSAILLIPYLGWTMFATALNIFIAVYQA